MIQSARERTRKLLEDKREQVELVAQQLLEKEILTRCVRLRTFHPRLPCSGLIMPPRHLCLSFRSESMVALLGRRPFDTRDEMDDLLDKRANDGEQPNLPLPDENTPAGRDSTPGIPTLEPGSLPSM